MYLKNNSRREAYKEVEAKPSQPKSASCHITKYKMLSGAAIKAVLGLSNIRIFQPMGVLHVSKIWVLMTL